MKSRTRTAAQLSKFLLLALFLALAPAALASSTWYVDGVNGNDINDCRSSQTACKTIGHAISQCSSGDSIMVAQATYTENLTIDRSLKIIGTDAATTIVDGNQAGSVFTINRYIHVTLSKMTIRNGLGGINKWGGTLTINKSIISGNVSAGWDGGIYNKGPLTISNSTIRDNVGLQAGGIYNFRGRVAINNSTISDNQGNFAGGIANYGGTITISSSTVTGNSGGGIGNLSGGTTTFQNNIVASSSVANCDGTGMTSNGYNLSSDGSCNFTGPGDMNNTKPLVGKLGNHGGPPQTVPLLSGSPAIDAGNPNGCTDDKGNLLKTDQRGWPRPGKHDTGGCDIGAFEIQHD